MRATLLAAATYFISFEEGLITLVMHFRVFNELSRRPRLKICCRGLACEETAIRTPQAAAATGWLSLTEQQSDFRHTRSNGRPAASIDSGQWMAGGEHHSGGATRASEMGKVPS